MTRRVPAVLLVLGAAAACSRPAPPAAPVQVTLPAGDLVDLSHTYDASTIFWPTAETFALQKVADGDTPAGFYYAANNFSGSEHGGTHIDAPVHFKEGGHTLDQIPLKKLVGPAYVIDVSTSCAGSPDYEIQAMDITSFEVRSGPIPPGEPAMSSIRYGMNANQTSSSLRLESLRTRLWAACTARKSPATTATAGSRLKIGCRSSPPRDR